MKYRDFRVSEITIFIFTLAIFSNIFRDGSIFFLEY